METFNILMLGGKRCGKTTVLGSMYNQIEKAVPVRICRSAILMTQPRLS